MTTRSLCVALAAASFTMLVGLPTPSSAAPGLVAQPAAATTLVEDAGYSKRRWRYRNYTRNETFVRAPFTRVYNGRFGTWVRAPFVNLWIPR